MAVIINYLIEWKDTHSYVMCSSIYEFEHIKPKPKLTADQIGLLKHLNQSYSWIAMDRDGGISFYKEKPIKYENVWDADIDCGICIEVIDLSFFNLSWSDTEPLNWVWLLEQQEELMAIDNGITPSSMCISE